MVAAPYPDRSRSLISLVSDVFDGKTGILPPGKRGFFRRLRGPPGIAALPCGRPSGALSLEDSTVDIDATKKRR
jgi:hypothetical protein